MTARETYEIVGSIIYKWRADKCVSSDKELLPTIGQWMMNVDLTLSTYT